MTIQTIIDSLSQLEKLHHSLLLLSKDKTEALKNGDIPAMQAVMVKERKCVQAVNQIETKRQQAVEQWISQHPDERAEATVTYLLKNIPDLADRESIEKHVEKLTDVALQLQQQEQLNKQLMQQSLQFIELSIDMLDPSMKNMNYNQGHAEMATSQPRSMFDSKA